MNSGMLEDPYDIRVDFKALLRSEQREKASWGPTQLYKVVEYALKYRRNGEDLFDCLHETLDCLDPVWTDGRLDDQDSRRVTAGGALGEGNDNGVRRRGGKGLDDRQKHCREFEGSRSSELVELAIVISDKLCQEGKKERETSGDGKSSNENKFIEIVSKELTQILDGVLQLLDRHNEDSRLPKPPRKPNANYTSVKKFIARWRDKETFSVKELNAYEEKIDHLNNTGTIWDTPYPVEGLSDREKADLLRGITSRVEADRERQKKEREDLVLRPSAEQADLDDGTDGPEWEESWMQDNELHDVEDGEDPHEECERTKYSVYVRQRPSPSVSLPTPSPSAMTSPYSATVGASPHPHITPQDHPPHPSPQHAGYYGPPSHAPPAMPPYGYHTQHSYFPHQHPPPHHPPHHPAPQQHPPPHMPQQHHQQHPMQGGGGGGPPAGYPPHGYSGAQYPRPGPYNTYQPVQQPGQHY
ncbi:hypothetical protein BDK51DRAFT_27654 [Blyttiomyces helicus]|uniref:Uncharacterized protein n=1 Tax=Blyttiomyces helicus TaxID=388810 RepID=A0A4V1IQU8_9FUNG|nr:hypothetical protein BDK51DRAFT_27654 [Blyttiomyces helicus]|eukprot:RKO87807.1 hypothetical protein BDK51DRAFT_27654 [Blyttiomyces helicus]